MSRSPLHGHVASHRALWGGHKVLRGFDDGPVVVQRFEQALKAVLEGIPRERVATCGAVARALGDVRAARAVATWLADHPEIPGRERVVRADGRPIRVHESAPPMGGSARIDDLRRPERFVKNLPQEGLFRRLRSEQRRMARRVEEHDVPTPIQSVGAVDVSYDRELAFAAAVRCDADRLEVQEIAIAKTRTEFPYVPGYLAYREFPAVDAALRRLRTLPDLLIVDGHGRLHPAHFGFACFVGVRLDRATIGTAKHLLVGKLAHTSQGRAGAVPILLDGKVSGYAWTPPSATRPLYVSVGHRVSLSRALDAVKQTTPRNYPEPLRIADRVSKEMKRESKG